VFFSNPDGDGPFVEVGYGFGIDFNDDGRAFVPFDMDGDGDLDIARISLQTLRLLENRTDRPHHFARMRLKATKTQHHALGAEVIVEAGGVTQRDYVKITAGFQTQVPFELHFGLGAATKIDRLTVRWPSGGTESHEDLPVDVVFVLHEGVTAAPQQIDVVQWPEASRPRTDRAFALDLAAAPVDGGAPSALAPAGTPVVVNFWAPWCAPCKEELPHLVAAAKAHRDVRFVGVSVELEKLDDVRKSVRELGLDAYDQRLTSEAIMASFFGHDGSAPLPSTFVLDANGQLSRAFYRKVGRDDLERAVAALAEIPVNPKLMLPVGEERLRSGDVDGARRAFEAGLKVAPDSAPLWTQLAWTHSEAGRAGDAEAAVGKALALDDAFPYAWYVLGVIHKRAGEPEPAIAALEKAVAFQPGVARYQMALGASYSHAKRLDDAMRSFAQVVAIEPTSVEGWLNLGKARVLGGRANAGEAFRRVLALEPDHREAAALLRRYGGAARQ